MSLLNKILLFSLLIGFLAGGIVIGGVFYFRNAPQETGQELLELKQKCRGEGEKYFQQDKESLLKKQREAGVERCYYIEPEYSYNQDLNTCLYFGGYTCDLTSVYQEGVFEGRVETTWIRHIVDVYSNKTLVDVYIENSGSAGDWEHGLIKNFWDKSEELGFGR